jgi:GntR family transcriptional repressor for pyruvate dehydrogenase complex
MTFKKIDNQTNTLVDKVEMSILEYIKSKKLVPGDTLPNEMFLASELGISRNVLREALSRLKMLGIVQSRTKTGIVIQEPSLLRSFEKVIEPYLLGEKAIVDMMGMRIVLEIGLTEFLFLNLTNEKINKLEGIVRKQEAIKYQLTVEQETEFHACIYEISGNNFIIQFQKIIHPVFQFAKTNYESYFAPVNERLLKEGKIVTHQDLFNCIKNRDMESYRNAIKIHLSPYMEFMYRKEEAL